MAGLLMPSLPYKRSAKHSIVGLGRRDRLSLLLNSSPLVLFPLTIALLAMVLAVPMVWLLNLYGVGAAYGVLGVCADLAHLFAQRRVVLFSAELRRPSGTGPLC